MGDAEVLSKKQRIAAGSAAIVLGLAVGFVVMNMFFTGAEEEAWPGNDEPFVDPLADLMGDLDRQHRQSMADMDRYYRRGGFD